MNKHLFLSPHGSEKPVFFYGYIVVVAAFFVMVILHGVLHGYGVFLKPLSSEFGWTRAVTSGAFSMSLFLLGLLYIGTGRLNDRFGPRILVMVCGTVFGLGYLLMSQVGALWQLYLFHGVIVAIGMSGGYVPLTSTVAKWFVRKRGLMTGIVTSGVGVGMMVGPPVAGWLISNYGWRIGYRATGISVLVLLVIAAQFLRREPAAVNHLSGSENDGGKEGSISEVGGFLFKEAVRTRQFWMLFIMYSCLGISLMAIMVHIVPHATDLGFSTITAAKILAIVGALNLVGRIGMGSVSDRVGTKRSLIISAGFLLTAFLVVLVAKDLRVLYLFAVIFGFGFGGTVALIAPATAELFGMKMHGAIMGVLAFAFSAGGSVGPIMAGHIFDVSGSYFLAFIASIVLSAIGLILASQLKPTREKAFV